MVGFRVVRARKLDAKESEKQTGAMVSAAQQA